MRRANDWGAERFRSYGLTASLEAFPFGVTWTRDFRGMVTRVMPVAKNRTGGRLLLDDVFVDSEYVDNYPIQAFEQLKVDGQVGKEGPDGLPKQDRQQGVQLIRVP